MACPRAIEGGVGSVHRFFSDGEKRRSTHLPDQPRKFQDTQDTFACRFYQRISTGAPCEGVLYTFRVELFDRFGSAIPKARYQVVLQGMELPVDTADENGDILVRTQALPATCVPASHDLSLLLFLHGNNGYVTADSAGKSRAPDWADAAATLAANQKQAAESGSGLDQLQTSQDASPADSTTVTKKPIVFVPEDAELTTRKYWSGPLPAHECSAPGYCHQIYPDFSSNGRFVGMGNCFLLSSRALV